VSQQLHHNDRVFRRFCYIGILLLCAIAATVPGKDVNWDQVNYHVYVAHAFLHDRLFEDTFAANIQSYINPIPFLPFYAVVASEIPSAVGAMLLGVVHGLSLIAVVNISCLVTRSDPQPHRFWLVSLIVALAGMHPLFLAGLGTSLSEMVAIVPALWAVYFQLRLLVRLASVPLCNGGTSDAAVAASLITIAFLWKLPMAFLGLAFAIALVLPTFWMVRTSLEKLQVAIWYCVGTFVGLLFGGAVHYWRVFVETGNPFFPYFNPVFESALYAPHAVVNHRFKTWDWSSIVSLPFRMLENASFVTAEIAALDPRYLVFLLILLALSWRRARIWLRGGSAGAEMQIVGASAKSRATRKGMPLDILIVGFVLIGYFAWVLTIGNGRYALVLHLLVPVGILMLSRRLTQRVEIQIALLMAAVLTQALANQISIEPSRWDREPHLGRWVKVDFPEVHNRPRALYVSLAFGDRRSWSAVVPQLDPSSRFMNLQGYENTRPDRHVGKLLSQRIETHVGPIYALLEHREFAADGPAKAEWRSALGRQLLAYGLQISDVGACRPIAEWYAQAATPDQPSRRVIAEVCPVARVEARDFRHMYAAEERAMAALEARYPSMLYPPDPAAYLYGALYCKFYTPKEVYVCAENGLVWGKRVAPSHELLFTTKVRP
jgi:hypothetical protein